MFILFARHPKLTDPACTLIPIITVHQSKGHEFDTVFVAGMTEDEFPSYYAKQARNIEEEKRLFYVAITRAKRHLVEILDDQRFQRGDGNLPGVRAGRAGHRPDGGGVVQGWEEVGKPRGGSKASSGRRG